MWLGEVANICPLVTQTKDTNIIVVGPKSWDDLRIYAGSTDRVVEPQRYSVKPVWSGRIVSKV